MLAGGQSRRMGENKASLVLDGSPLLGRMVQKLVQIGLRVQVAGVAGEHEFLPAAIPDEQSGCGPIAGLQTALRHSRSPLVVVLGVDIPLISGGVLTGLLGRARTTGALVTMPRALGRPQPLCAVYRRELYGPVTEQLQAGTWKLMLALQEAVALVKGRIDIFDIESVSTAGGIRMQRPAAWEFLNCNTPADVSLAERLLTQSHAHPQLPDAASSIL